MMRRAGFAMLVCACVVLMQFGLDRLDRYNEQQERQAQAEREREEKWRVLDERVRQMTSYDRIEAP